MSKRNTLEAKTAARERLRVERERQAKRAKARRQLLVALSVVVVLAIAGGIGFLIMQANKPGYWEAAKNDKLVAPAHTGGTDGTTVIIGRSGAKNTLKEYEDPRCPVCGQFEQGVGELVQKDVKDGKYKIEFIGATFLDRNGSEGSKNALSALGAALDVSPEAFSAYKSALYSPKWHPIETDDKFKDDGYLIKVADTVDALKGNTAFQKDVRDGTFDRWALEMSKRFDHNKDGVDGTPSLFMNGRKLVGSDGNVPMTPQDFTAAVDKLVKK
jgi:protein-disulfide isomerase